MDTPLELAERLRRLGAAARTAEELADDARAARDAEIEQAEVAGHSVRWIAGHVDLALATVHRIVLRRTAARQERLRRAAGL